MKIALPVTNNNQIDSHFGHCDFYRIFSISEEREITDQKTIPSLQGCGCKLNIASVLAADGVNIMLAGGIGMGAVNVLKSAGIDVVRGCSGDATEVLMEYLSGNISDSGEVCHHHESHGSEGENHQCQH